MTEQREIDAIDGAAAFRTLYLLPTAPRSLAGEVYRALRDKCLLAANEDGPQLDDELARLDRANVVIARGTNGVEHDAPAQRSPWALLHVDCEAPREVVELAYRFWQRERGLDAVDFTPPARPRIEKVSPAIQDAINTTVVDGRPADSPAGPAMTSQRDEDVRPITMPSPPTTTARLVVEAGTAHPASVAVGESPLRIGGDPACDIVVGAAGHRKGRTEARLWRRDGRVLFHGVAGNTTVNGHAVGWAVLDPGDTVRVGEATFRYEARC